MPSIETASTPVSFYPNEFSSPYGNDGIVPLYSSVPLKSPVAGCLPCVVCGSSNTRYQILSSKDLNSKDLNGVGGYGDNGVGGYGDNGVVITLSYPTTYPPKPPIPPNPPYDPLSFCNNPTQSPTFTWNETLNTEYTWCISVKSGERSFTNPLNSAAYLYICGSVDDDILINNQVMQPGQFVYDCGLNGAHAFSIVYLVQPNEVTFVGVNNNFTDLSGIDVVLYYLPV